MTNHVDLLIRRGGTTSALIIDPQDRGAVQEECLSLQ